MVRFFLVTTKTWKVENCTPSTPKVRSKISYLNKRKGTIHLFLVRISNHFLFSFRYVVRAGTPGFICVIEGTTFQIDFLSKYKK